jgi:uncharacterized membrane protein
MLLIEQFIKQSELQHRADICFTVEANLPIWRVLRGVTARQRALEVFSQLRLWDTEDNSGVLLYLLLADKGIEIVADRGINKLISPVDWEKISEKIKIAFRSGNFEEGIISGLTDISLILKKHFPSSGKLKNEISDKPVIL